MRQKKSLVKFFRALGCNFRNFLIHTFFYPARQTCQRDQRVDTWVVFIPNYFLFRAFLIKIIGLPFVMKIVSSWNDWGCQSIAGCPADSSALCFFFLKNSFSQVKSWLSKMIRIFDSYFGIKKSTKNISSLKIENSVSKRVELRQNWHNEELRKLCSLLYLDYSISLNSWYTVKNQAHQWGSSFYFVKLSLWFS